MPEFFRLDEFAIRADLDITRRDRTRMLGFGFDILSRGYQPCPGVTLPRWFRLDEFAALADGVICIRDRVRFTSFGFDIAPAGLTRNLDTYVNVGAVPAPVTVAGLFTLVLDMVVEELTSSGGGTYESGKNEGDPRPVTHSLSTDMWEVDEILSYISEVQAEFLKRSSIVFHRAGIPTIPQIQRHELPAGSVAIKRVGYRSAVNVISNLHRVDEWELDHLVPDWQYETEVPLYWLDGPPGVLRTGKSGSIGGRLEVLYAPRGDDLTDPTSTDETAVPNDFVFALRWGVIARMLSKVGRANDPERAAYARARYEEGLSAARLILGGWDGR
jgi:hypothetical protein